MGTEAGIVAAVARTSQGHHHAVVDAVGRRRWSKMEDGAELDRRQIPTLENHVTNCLKNLNLLT